MIKASGKTGQGIPLFYIALDEVNIERMKLGEPVFIRSADMTAMGFQPMVVVIDYGQVDEATKAKLRAHGITLKE